MLAEGLGGRDAPGLGELGPADAGLDVEMAVVEQRDHARPGALSTLRARPARRSNASSGGEPSMPVARSIESRTGSARGVLTRARAIQCPSARLAPRVETRLNSGQASRTHVHPVAPERDALGVEQAALALALGERPVGAHDAVPGHVGVVAGGEHRAREARRAGGDVAVGADEARRRVADAREDASRCGSPGYRRAFVRHGTYSIVAFDPATGEHGAAVHSHWFSVGSLCIWARPGHRRGGDAVRRRAGPRPARARPPGGGRDRRATRSRRCSAPTRSPRCARSRIVDAAGRVAVHTGADCIPCAGDATGEHVSAQANMMARDTVPAAMVAGFEAAEGDLAARLLAALDAAEGEGGDVRGRQSAALVVVPREGERLAGPLRPAGRGPRATRSRSCGGWSRSRAPTSSRARPTS